MRQVRDTDKKPFELCMLGQKMIEVRIEVDLPDNWVKNISTEHSSKIRIMDLRGTSKDRQIQDFVEITTTARIRELFDVFSRMDGISGVDLVQIEPNRIMGAITTDKCPVCSIFAGPNCSVISAESRGEGKMEWNLLISGSETLNLLSEKMNEGKLNYRVVSVRNLKSKRELTARQHEIAKIAFELGYFDFPKKITLVSLSERLHIAPPTLSEILRQVEKNVLAFYFQTRWN